MWGASWDGEGQKQGCLSLAITPADGQLAAPSPPRRWEDQYWREILAVWRREQERLVCEGGELSSSLLQSQGLAGKAHPSTGTGGWPLPIT